MSRPCRGISATFRLWMPSKHPGGSMNRRGFLLGALLLGTVGLLPRRLLAQDPQPQTPANPCTPGEGRGRRGEGGGRGPREGGGRRGEGGGRGPREGGRSEGGRGPREGGRGPREGGRGPREGGRGPREGGRGPRG